MGLFDFMLDKLAAQIGKRIQGDVVKNSYSDAGKKGTDYSVESMVCESLANLVTLDFTMPIAGETARAKWLDEVSDDFKDEKLTEAISMAFMTGDMLVVPSWNGRMMDNVLVPSDSFAVLGANGHKLTSVIYIVDQKKEKSSGKTYTLARTIDLVSYQSDAGYAGMANRYRSYIFENGNLSTKTLADFPDWEATNEQEWLIPNVDRLLIGRYRSFTLNPLDPNAQKGAPICFGASAPIREIHYLTQQMHNEFSLSEKAIIADKTLFNKRVIRDEQGNILTTKLEFPEGKKKLFMDVAGTGGTDMLHEWAPSIQLQPYLDALDKQFQEVERCVGVSSGILSNLNEQSYQNVDNVRKSTIKTQAFIESARRVAEGMLEDMVYSWDVIANYYELNPVGDYSMELKWSDDYINTFTDQQNAILAGNSIGATDAVDYRMFVMGESPEVARQRVDEIKASQPASIIEVG